MAEKEEVCQSQKILNESGFAKRARKCENRGLVVFIMWRGKQLGLCQVCWDKIADLDIEWGEKNGKVSEEEKI